MKRTKRRPAQAEWDFWPLHDAPSEEQRFALTWELDRALGSKNPPYLSLPKATRRKVTEDIVRMNSEWRTPLRQLPLSRAVGYMQQVKGTSGVEDDENYMLSGHGTTAHLRSEEHTSELQSPL
jgi:hypothetical protein